MQRYFIDYEIDKDYVMLDESMMHHLNHVLRIKKTMSIIVVDSTSNVVHVHVEPHQTKAKIIEKLQQPDDAYIDITLAVALLKKDKFEWVIQKASELGVARIVPFVSERTIVDVSYKDFEKKRQRYQIIAKEACEQSHRKTVCKILPLHNFNELDRFDAQFKGICYENQETSSTNLKGCMHQSTLLVIGPEGGFSQREVAWARDHDFKLITLGHKILRAETAAIAACAMIEAYHHE